MRQSIEQDSRDIERAIRKAQHDAPLVAERVLKREMLRGQRDIIRRYRSLSAPGPQGTAVRSDTFRSSVNQVVVRNRNEAVGTLGYFGLGILPVYFERWEGLLSSDPGRPAGGALEAVRPDITNRINRALDRELADAVGAS